MEERRKLDRVNYPAKSVIVVVDSGEKFFVQTENVSPLGMGLKAEKGVSDLLHKDIIIVAETLIMYANVVRQEVEEDGVVLGISAKKFTPDVLEYLFEHIGGEE